MSKLLLNSSCRTHKHIHCPHRGLTALPSKAVAAGHQVVSIWRDVTVGLDVLLCRKSIGHLPRTTVPHSAQTHNHIMEQQMQYDRCTY